MTAATPLTASKVFLFPVDALQRRVQRKETPDRLSLRWMQAQCGLISRSQAIATGLTPKAIRHRIETGLWVEVHRGVFASAATKPTWEGRLWAATLLLEAGGAVASHRAAARSHGLEGVDGEYVEVTVTHPGPTAPGQILIHKSKERSRTTRIKGLPVTAVERTLVDLGAVCSEEAVEIALDCALRRRLTSLRKVELELSSRRGKGNRGSGVLARILEVRGACAPSGSVLETKVARVLRGCRLPEVRRQFSIFDGDRHVATVDFAFPAAKVAVEALGYDPHAQRQRWARDWARHNDLTQQDWDVVYVTSADLRDPKAKICAPIRAALRRRSASLG